MTNSHKRPHFTTPVGTASYCRLLTPDEKFKDERTNTGKFSVKLKLTKAEAAPLIAKIDAEIETAYKAMCAEKGKVKLKRSVNSPYKAEEDDTGAETGNVVFSFGLKGAYVDRESKTIVKMSPPPVYDRAGKAVTDEIWGGSQIQVCYDFRPYFSEGLGYGMSLGLKAVRVVELVSKGQGGRGGSAESFGFAVEAPEEVEEFAAPIEAAPEATNGKAGDF